MRFSGKGRQSFHIHVTSYENEPMIYYHDTSHDTHDTCHDTGHDTRDTHETCHDTHDTGHDNHVSWESFAMIHAMIQVMH